jgi:hypothetical protein
MTQTIFLMDAASNSINHTLVMNNKRFGFVEKTKTDEY